MEQKSVACILCNKQISPGGLLKIDGDVYCRRCIHDGVEPIAVYPIGVVRKDGKDGESRIILQPFMKKFLWKLDEEAHLTIVYFLHELHEIPTHFMRRFDQKSVGVFASRTPSRPTPIAVTEVELVRIEGTTLAVRGLDAFDKSPVLDIKLGYKEIASGGGGRRRGLC